MPPRLTITTPSYYVNSLPHIGTGLTTVLSDVLARYHKLQGQPVWFVTGTDENGLKVKEAAERAGKEPQAFVDGIAAEFQRIFAGMRVEYDDFLRTSEERHRRAVSAFFELLRERGHIYTGEYEGWYDVSTETYYRESELVDGKSPDGNEVRLFKETNHFFRLSAFAEPLLAHIEANPSFILPENRRNEVVSFIRQGLRDASISRHNFGRGIPIPGDEGQVFWVWFDALINYVSSAGWPDPGWEERWHRTVQLMGKDILTRFHATLWPAMLIAAGIPLPETLFGHGWVLMGAEKISKSKGNVVAPLDLASELAEQSGCDHEIAIDAVRYHMVSTMPYDQDTTFTRDDFDRRYNSDLANDLGNALNRSLAMAHKFVGGIIPDGESEPAVTKAIVKAKADFERAIIALRFDHAADAAMGVARFLNRYIDTRAPWALAKANDPTLPAVLRSMLLGLRASEGLVRPIMPQVADAIAAQLGLTPTAAWAAIGDEASLPGHTQLHGPQPIFPRLDPTKKPMSEPTPSTPNAPTPNAPEITIDDILKVQLRVARVQEAEPVEGSDKLMKLQVVVGTERRQIVAGIRKSYEPTDLIGRQIVVVANLKPARLRGVESQGMLLAATDESGNAILLMPDRETPEGAGVK